MSRGFFPGLLNGCLLLPWLTVTAAAIPVTIDIVEMNAPSDGGAGTYQSHNQKVVANDNGIFMTHMDTTPDVTPIVWRLSRSIDGGQTFTTVYEASELTRAPAMETDENNNIYLSYPTFGVNTKLLRFTAANGYTAPDISKTYTVAASAGKYSMAYDQGRQQFYLATQWGKILTVDKLGNLLNSQQVFSSSEGDSHTAYPHLFVDSTGDLHHAVTTADTGNHIPYESIRYVKSTDGGVTWETMGGTPLSTPTSPLPTGPSDMINLPDEVTPWATWLGTMHVKNDKVHFAYRTVNPWDPDWFGNPTPIAPRQHYMRFDGQTGTREIDSWSDWGQWQGTDITIDATSMLLASDPEELSGPLYAVARSSDSHLSALISYDNGSSWEDYATTSAPFSGIYAVGGFRELTPDGKIIGSFSGVPSTGGPWRTYYFEFKGVSSDITLGDLDGDEDIDGDDWSQFVAGMGANLSGLTPEQRRAQGDLNGDEVNNYDDFVLFRNSYLSVHGPGSFASMFSESIAVPEPNALMLMMTAGLLALSIRQRSV